jgi:hypothetical protein
MGIDVGEMSEWVRPCAASKTEFLVVLDACCSTILAGSVRAQMLRLAASLLTADQRAFAEKHVGFITSGKGGCARSTAMVSKDESLVNLFGVKAAPDDWARGFFQRSTMFLRQFNWLWPTGSGHLTRCWMLARL